MKSTNQEVRKGNWKRTIVNSEWWIVNGEWWMVNRKYPLTTHNSQLTEYTTHNSQLTNPVILNSNCHAELVSASDQQARRHFQRQWSNPVKDTCHYEERSDEVIQKNKMDCHENQRFSRNDKKEVSNNYQKNNCNYRER